MWRTHERTILLPLWSGAIALLLFGTATVPVQAEEKFFPDPVYGVEDSYIVLLPRSTEPTTVLDEATRLTEIFGGRLEVTWCMVLRGFLARMSAKEAQDMAQDSGVVGVYQNQRVEGDEAIELGLSNTPYCYGPEYPPGSSITHQSALPSPPPATQTIPCDDPSPDEEGCLGNWGLDRLDSFTALRDGQWVYPEDGGNVQIYIQDTGARSRQAGQGRSGAASANS